MDENGKLDNEISVISSEVQYALCKVLVMVGT